MPKGQVLTHCRHSSKLPRASNNRSKQTFVGSGQNSTRRGRVHKLRDVVRQFGGSGEDQDYSDRVAPERFEPLDFEEFCGSSALRRTVSVRSI